MSRKPEGNKKGKKVRPPRTIATTTDLPRIVAEFCVAALSLPYIKKKTPEGDGHTVLIIPGFLSDDTKTSLLRRFLNKQGYNVVGWKQGHNIHVTKEMFDNFEKRIKDLYEEKGEKISLVGQSLGGLLALIAAARNPQYIRSVTTLGSPIQGAEYPEGIASSLGKIFEYLTEEDDYLKKLTQEAVPVEKMLKKLKNIPVTAIYSKGDGIISSDIATLPKENDKHRNVEIGALSSHTGMVFNLQVFVVLADRLAADTKNPGKFNYNNYLWAFPRNICGVLIKQMTEPRRKYRKRNPEP